MTNRLLLADYTIRIADYENPRMKSLRKRVYDEMVVSPGQIDHCAFHTDQIVTKSIILLATRIGDVCLKCHSIYMSVHVTEHSKSLCDKHKAYLGYDAKSLNEDGTVTCDLCLQSVRPSQINAHMKRHTLIQMIIGGCAYSYYEEL